MPSSPAFRLVAFAAVVVCVTAAAFGVGAWWHPAPPVGSGTHAGTHAGTDSGMDPGMNMATTTVPSPPVPEAGR